MLRCCICLPELLVQPPVILGRRAGPAPQGWPGRSRTSLQNLLARLLRAAVADEHQILQLPVGTQPWCSWASSVVCRQLPLHGVQIGGGGHGAEGHRHLRGGGSVSRGCPAPARACRASFWVLQLVLLGVQGGDPSAPASPGRPASARAAGIGRVVKADSSSVITGRGVSSPPFCLGRTFSGPPRASSTRDLGLPGRGQRPRRPAASGRPTPGRPAAWSAGSSISTQPMC